MPELPEVETVRRMLQAHIPGRRIVRVQVSRHRLRSASLGRLPRALTGRTLGDVDRRGKFLLIALEDGATLLSHLGMSGRWLHGRAGSTAPGELHVHARFTLEGGDWLWYQDIRRFGMLRVVPAGALAWDPSLRLLGPDPLAAPPDGPTLRAAARGHRVSIKTFLLDQRRIAGLGNIYVSEILHRARVDPRRRCGGLDARAWERIAAEIPIVLAAAIARMGTTFSTFRTIWNEPGQYGDQLRVYDRAGKPCGRCGTPIRRILQSGRSTFFCPRCSRQGA